MKLSAGTVADVALATGFHAEMVEKVAQLLALLRGMAAHPFLAGRWGLKGGTALNLFVFDIPRLSVDIDANYTGEPDRAGMLAERPQIDQALRAVCAREDFSVEHVASDHAADRWQLRYPSVLSPVIARGPTRRSGVRGDFGATLKLDVSYTSRVPLWPLARRDSQALGQFAASGVPLLDLHELAAGKLRALLSRRVSRDLFATHRLFTDPGVRAHLDPARLRLAFVVYGAMSRTDWRTVSPDQVTFDPIGLKNRLIPVLRADSPFAVPGQLDWVEQMVAECREALAAVLPLTAAERAFLDGVLDRGDIDPSPLTADAELAMRIQAQPHLQWKAENVRRHQAGQPIRPNPVP